METSAVSDIVLFIERVGPLQGFLVLSLLSAIFIFTRYFMKKMDKNFIEVKDMNESLKKEIENLKKENIQTLQSIKDESERKMDAKKNLMRNHPFFSTIDYLIDVKIPGIHFKSGFKKTAFTDILTFKLRASQDLFRTFVANESNYNTGSLEFRSYVTKIIKDSYIKFITECERSSIPPPVVESFNSWVNPLSRFFFSAVENICDSKIYETNVDKVNAILNINLAVLDEMVSNIELYLDEINGDFNGLTYKGILSKEEHTD